MTVRSQFSSLLIPVQGHRRSEPIPVAQGERWASTPCRKPFHCRAHSHPLRLGQFRCQFISHAHLWDVWGNQSTQRKPSLGENVQIPHRQCSWPGINFFFLHQHTKMTLFKDLLYRYLVLSMVSGIHWGLGIYFLNMDYCTPCHFVLELLYFGFLTQLESLWGKD